MIATNGPTLVILALGCLILNAYAFRSNSAVAGWNQRTKLQMAAVWATIIVGLTALIAWLEP